MRRGVALGILIGYLLALAISATAVGRAHWVRERPHETRAHWLRRAAAHYRYVANAGHGQPRRSHARALRLVSRLERAINPVTALTGYPPHHAAWLCIHRGEGAWNANTGNGYYGGLQMDTAFMRAYGAQLLAEKGTADRWTPLEQEWVAERAYQSGRGFYPWPNTARACGLIG